MNAARLLLAGLLLVAGSFALHAQHVMPAAADMAHPPGLPEIGKWMIDREGTIAHWLGELDDGRKLREPINVIFVDAGATTAEAARQRLVAASTAAGYPIRFGHSTGYRGAIGGVLYVQLPAGRDDAFSNGLFEMTNNHGRIFGSHPVGGAYVSIAAFSQEDIRLLRWPMHGFASFNRAREDYATQMDRATPFKRDGHVLLQNAIVRDATVRTGDHDGRAVVLRAMP